MSEDLTEEEAKLSPKLHVVQAKTIAIKKGLNVLSSRKKEYISEHLQPPEELITFLQSYSLFTDIHQKAQVDITSIVVRRYVEDIWSQYSQSMRG